MICSFKLVDTNNDSFEVFILSSLITLFLVTPQNAFSTWVYVPFVKGTSRYYINKT